MRGQGISDKLNKLLMDADKRSGLPPGTMRSILHQETGGNQRFINNPSEYHYPLNEQGRRVAGHTGKISTAFGPFGILESTAAQPGYGVAPLRDKSLEEQIRFASDYLSARARHAGSLEAGLRGYGEGDKYAQSVLGRIEGYAAPNPAPVQDLGFNEMAASNPIQNQVQQQHPSQPTGHNGNQWAAMQQAVQNAEQQVPVQAARDSEYGYGYNALAGARQMASQFTNDLVRQVTQNTPQWGSLGGLPKLRQMSGWGR